MPQGKKTVPEHFHPYLKKTYGNILDQYDNTTYNAKLYIINSQDGSGEASQSSETERSDTGPPGNASSVLTAAPDRTIVIAQTGVTAGNTIESITIPTFGGQTLADIEIVVKQPNRADLLDQLVLARSFLNIEGLSAVYMYLEISFLGYEAEDDLFSSLDGGTDTSGQLADIIGPYRWKLIVRSIECSLDKTGSAYTIKLAPLDRMAFENRRYRLNQNLTAKGKTITEMITSIKDGLNKFYQNNNDKIVKDEVDFDLSGLLKSASNNPDANKVLIDDENLILPDVNTGDVNKAPLNKADAGADTSADTRINESQEQTGSGDELTNEQVTNVINFMPGESIDDIIHKVLAMCPEARSRFSRKEDPDNIDDQACRKDQAFIQRLKINAGVEELGFDKRTNMSAYKIIYRPVLYRTADSNQFAIPEENQDLKPEEVQSRFDEIIASGNCRKGYQYLFTGMNDQIIDLNINYDNGMSVIMTPKRGLVGGPDAANAKEKIDNVTKDEDTNVSGLLDTLSKGFEALAKDTISDLFNGNYSGLQGGLNSLYATLNQQGFSNTQLSQLAQAIDTGAQAELNQFLDTIDSATLRNLATNLLINPVNPTTGSPPEYSPEQSGYQYSEDFFSLDQVTGIDVGDLNSLGFLAENQGYNKRSQMEIPQKETDTPTNNPVEGVTVDLNNPQSYTIFGQLVEQSRAAAFMQNVEMTIRGDPWYLGYDTSEGQNNNTQAAQSSTDSHESSQPEYAYFGGDDNYFFLEIAAPRPWDFDYRDEDSLLNTGYWMNTNTSYVFTGLYKLRQVNHNFSNGLYTIDIQGAKEQAIPASNLDRQQQGDN